MEKIALDAHACECGCNSSLSLKSIKRGSRFVVGHSVVAQWRDPAKRMILIQRKRGRPCPSSVRKKISQSVKRSWTNREIALRHNEGAVRAWRGEKGPQLRRTLQTVNVRQWSNVAYRKFMSDKAKAEWADPIKRAIWVQKMSQRKLKQWSDPIYQQKMCLAKNIKPNKPERLLSEALHRAAPNCFSYVGDFSKWIASKNPDFLCEEMRIIVELFGNYWHKPEEVEKRIQHFEGHNYRCIIIWESELCDIDVVLQQRLLPIIKHAQMKAEQNGPSSQHPPVMEVSA